MTIFGPCAAKPPHHADTAATVVNPHKKRKGKKMSKAIRASALVLLLACSAQAGWMPNDTPAPPPPQPASVAQSGYMPNDSPTQPQPTSTLKEQGANGWMGNDAAASLTQLTLDLLAVLPSLL
jgi:hypothetical protein